jgi:ATP-binding protein involved in chromosome partitioning
MGLTKELVRTALQRVVLPGYSRDVVAEGQLLWTSACDSFASVKVELPGVSDAATFQGAAALLHRAVLAGSQQSSERVDSFIVEFVNAQGTVVHTARFGSATPPPGSIAANSAAKNGGGGASGQNAGSPGAAGHQPIPGLRQNTSGLPGIRHVIAVGAGKGGVGKSTVALNIAVGLARRGHAVGLLDGDIYGPSMPTMLNLGALDAVVVGGMLQPFAVHGIKCMTIGKLVDAEKPLIWRGPMAHGAFKQLTEQTQWGELDYLIIDLPPGTGDISLTMAQNLKLTGAVVVCTPQRVAQDDAVRAARMFQQLGIEVLGVVENMSFFVGDDGKVYDIFGKGGAETMAQRLGVPFLGAIPITMSLRANSDSGNPTANYEGGTLADDRLKSSLEVVLGSFENQVALATMKSGQSRPTLTIS